MSSEVSTGMDFEIPTLSCGKLAVLRDRCGKEETDSCGIIQPQPHSLVDLDTAELTDVATSTIMNKKCSHRLLTKFRVLEQRNLG